MSIFGLPIKEVYKIGSFKFKQRPTVIHRQTCPDCERTLVNIYYSAELEQYKCKKCMDKHLGEKSGVE